MPQRAPDFRGLSDQAHRHPSPVMPGIQECVQGVERLASGAETAGGPVFIKLSSTAPSGPGGRSASRKGERILLECRRDAEMS